MCPDEFLPQITNYDCVAVHLGLEFCQEAVFLNLWQYFDSAGVIKVLPRMWKWKCVAEIRPCNYCQKSANRLLWQKSHRKTTAMKSKIVFCGRISGSLS